MSFPAMRLSAATLVLEVGGVIAKLICLRRCGGQGLGISQPCENHWRSEERRRGAGQMCLVMRHLVKDFFDL